MRVAAAGDPGPWRQQAVRGRWDADALRDVVRDYALETPADLDAVLVLDETGFLKQGEASCGGHRQYTGSAGTSIATLAAVEGQHWAIEDAFETAKTELGLAHNETRSWHG